MVSALRGVRRKRQRLADVDALVWSGDSEEGSPFVVVVQVGGQAPKSTVVDGGGPEARVPVIPSLPLVGCAWS